MLHSSGCSLFRLFGLAPFWGVVGNEADERCSTVPGAMVDGHRLGVFLLEYLPVCHELRLDRPEVLLAPGESGGLVYRPV